MHSKVFTIYSHPQAPEKPMLGSPCNGCGVCCLVAPCPVGVVLSRSRLGACQALRWNASENRYRCGAIETPHAVLMQALPQSAAGIAKVLAPLLRRWARRWIAVGIGCDSSVEPAAPYLTPPNAADSAPHHD
jgi:hypothetical protein